VEAGLVSTDPVQMGSCSSNHGNAKTGVEDRWALFFNIS